jgi:L-seryl-tRNA(Ser) seleniumtransferase
LAIRLAALPSVDRLLNTQTLTLARQTHGQERVTAAVRAHLAALRVAAAGDPDARLPGLDDLASAIDATLASSSQPSLRKVFNLTGTVLHTNFGRALLPDVAIAALATVASDPCNLEFDLVTGGRGERDEHVEATICALTGAEAALVVNNNAAAVFLMLNTLALRRDVVVSRGELVEIGGQFRIPDIMTRAGAKLREVGTTNRTHARDYADAIGARTAMVLKVHASNYEIRGFVSSVAVEEVAHIARERDVVLGVDLGSGTLVDMRRWGLPYEPTVRATIAAGADVVTFSGDKLLGGPQCGIIAGRRELVERMRRNPLKRALRVDKLILAALEQVLRLYLDTERLPETLPTLRMLIRTPQELGRDAQRVADELARRLPAEYAIEVVECSSQIGSGALPVEVLPSNGVQVRSLRARRERHREIKRLHDALRRLPTPVIGRIDDGALVLDCRCVANVDDLAGALSHLDSNLLPQPSGDSDAIP